jgi:hypothetical protein
MGKECSIHSCSSTVESSLEFATCYHFEYSPDVKSFEPQPLGYNYYFNGRTCKYTPDFKIVFVDSRLPVFIEVKPFSKTFKEDFRLRFEQKQIVAEQMNVPLVLMTEKEICIEPLLENLKILHRYASHDELSQSQQLLLGMVGKAGTVRIAQAQTLVDLPKELAFVEVMGLLSKQQLKCDIEQKLIDSNTEVWVNYVS